MAEKEKKLINGLPTGNELPIDMRNALPVPYLRPYQVPRAGGINTFITRVLEVNVWNNHNKTMEPTPVIFVTNGQGVELEWFVKVKAQAVLHGINDALDTFDRLEWIGREICLTKEMAWIKGKNQEVIRIEKANRDIAPGVPLGGAKTTETDKK